VTWNAAAPATLNKGFQTSATWIRVVMEVALVRGVLRSVAAAVGFALVCVLVFTGSLVVATLCSLTIASIVTCTFGTLQLFGWSLGIAEVVCITMLVGFSVDYTVHLCDSFIHNGVATHEDRALNALAALDSHTQAIDRLQESIGINLDGLPASPSHGQAPPEYGLDLKSHQVPPLERFTSAMNHIGAPVFHSAVTTSVAASILIFCQTSLLVKVGMVVAINASIGVLLTFVLLGAMLVTCGPSDFSFLDTSCAWGLRFMALAAAALAIAMAFFGFDPVGMVGGAV